MTASLNAYTTSIVRVSPNEAHLIHGHIALSIKSKDVALAALLMIQGSCCILSFLFPEKAYIIQTGVLTTSAFLFFGLMIRAQQQAHLVTLKSPQNHKYNLSPPPSPISASEPLLIHEKPLFYTRIDTTFKKLLSQQFWLKMGKIIPHPDSERLNK